MKMASIGYWSSAIGYPTKSMGETGGNSAGPDLWRKPNSVRPILSQGDHLSHPAKAGRSAKRNATITRELSVTRVGKRTNSLFCLAPQGVFPAIRLTPDPVGSYPAISPLPSTILRSTVSVIGAQPQDRAGRYIFCDTIRQLELAPEMPALSPGMLLSWCSDFPLPHPVLGAAAIAYLLSHFRLSTVFPQVLPAERSPGAKIDSNPTDSRAAGYGLISLPTGSRG